LGNANANIDDEFVFMPAQTNRMYAYRQLVRQFDVLLHTAKLRESADGDVRTLYSLRCPSSDHLALLAA
jgi:hypothetical protein